MKTLCSGLACRFFLFQVNNAGIVKRGGIENTSLDQYDEVMNINNR